MRNRKRKPVLTWQSAETGGENFDAPVREEKDSTQTTDACLWKTAMKTFR